MIIKFLNNNLKNESNVIEPRQSRNDSVKQFMDPFYAAVTQDLQFRKIQLPTKIFGERERERERERLNRRSFLVNLAKYLKTPILKNSWEGLLLYHH